MNNTYDINQNDSLANNNNNMSLSGNNSFNSMYNGAAKSFNNEFNNKSDNFIGGGHQRVQYQNNSGAIGSYSSNKTKNQHDIFLQRGGQGVSQIPAYESLARDSGYGNKRPKDLNFLQRQNTLNTIRERGELNDN